MEILILNLRDQKHPHAGGAELFTHEVAKRWVCQGHTVSWIAANFKGGARNEVVDGIKIVRLGNYVTVRLLAREYYNTHFKGKCDIVIDEYTLKPFFAPKYAREPVVFVVFEVIGQKHLSVLPPGMGHIIYYWFEPRWYKFYRDVPTVTISRSTKNDLLKRDINKVDVVPIGIGHNPLDRIPNKEEVPTLLYVGLLKKANRVDHCIRALQLIASEIPETRLWIVGRGSELKRLKKLAYGSETQFFGFVDEAYKLELMGRAHALLVPGIREGWGLAITEANACGTPAIGYDIIGHRDAIRDGQTGVLTDATPEAMAKAAIRLLRDPKMRQRMSENALRWSTQFSWDRTAAAFLDVIERLSRK
jgi:glycosyltransferase involved in cell wall biosynthesis